MSKNINAGNKPAKIPDKRKNRPPSRVEKTVHDYIAFNSNEEYERSIFQFFQMIENISIKNAKKRINEVVSRVVPKKQYLIYNYSNRGRNTGTLYAFDTGFKFQNGVERIFAYTLKNTRKEERTHEYYGLFFERESMLRDIIRSRTNEWHIGDIVFSGIEDMNNLLNRIAEEAFYENWTFPNYPSRVCHPILKNYIENTYYQLVHQDKIYINEKEEKMLLNTGLIDTSFNEIFLVCDLSKKLKKDSLFIKEFISPEIYKSSNRVFSNYSRNQIIDMATFYNDPGDLLFDWETAQKPGGINISDEHIFKDNMDRINQGLRDSRNHFDFSDPSDVSRCRQMFEGALKASLEMSKRNYKFVAPQFWPATGQIQFLIPIYLEGIQEVRQGETKDVLPPTVALSMELVHGQYIGTTILTLDMAYQNARLIARPDGFWLDSTKIFGPQTHTSPSIQQDS